ncbi:MAG: pyrimidine dimer DNA glycosylase/endonuclease V [bacterium]
MRLWSIHPEYLDRVGLVASWREALLAQAVLAGRTRGYRNHPQLDRFKAHPAPQRAIAGYLAGIFKEARARGYAYDPGLFVRPGRVARIAVSRGQLAFELEHLRRKLRLRSPEWHAWLSPTRRPRPHPLFFAVPGGVADWERAPDRFVQ